MDNRKDMDMKDALTFDDVLLVPRYSEIIPPEVTLESRLTETIPLKIPLLSSAMDKVTESRTAIAMARAGGAGVIHRNLSNEEQAREVQKVKKSESGMILDPVTMRPDQKVGDAHALKKQNGISGLPIIQDGILVGIATNRDLRFEEDNNRSISEVMTPFEKLVTGDENISMKEAVRLMHEHRVEKLPIIDSEKRLKGLITVKDIESTISYPLANRDGKGSLIVGAAVGTGQKALDRAVHLEKAGADFIVVDTAHGDSKNVVTVVKWIKDKYPDLAVIAGNVATAEGTEQLFKAGADCVKVGMGCGSICTTRVISGVGVPQFSALKNCVPVAKKYGRQLIADGGIKFSGDVVKALALGVNAVMIGSLFAGTDEAPGELIFYQGRSYKSYRGMGSVAAMRAGSQDRYGQAGVSDDELVPEGIEGRVPYRGPLPSLIHQLVGGVRAGLGYLGCRNLEELVERAEFVRITNSGLQESHVHDVFVTREAPNYRPSN